jgi:hypothetical protein
MADLHFPSRDERYAAFDNEVQAIRAGKLEAMTIEERAVYVTDLLKSQSDLMDRLDEAISANAEAVSAIRELRHQVKGLGIIREPANRPVLTVVPNADESP